MTTTTTHRRIGQQSEWTATFRDTTDALVAPSTVTFQWKVRDTPGIGTAYVYGMDSEVSSPSLGVYVFESPPYTVSGTYAVRVSSTNPATANEQTIDVVATLFAAVVP